MTGKFTDVMKAAKDEKKKPVKDTSMKNSSDKIVNVCIKVPLALRREWTIEATSRDMSIKDLIIDAVEEYLQG
jgi:hypothetical protein